MLLSHIFRASACASALILAAVLCAPSASADLASLKAAYPKAAGAIDALADSPLFIEALSDPEFFNKMESDRGFQRDLRGKLDAQAYRRFGIVPSVRNHIMPGALPYSPALVLAYQTTYDGLSTWGGRDGRNTVYGASEDPAIRQKWDALIAERQAMRSNQRTTMDPAINEWLRSVLPDTPLAEVRADIDARVAALAEAFAPYGARKLERSFFGQEAWQILPHIAIHLRDCTFGLTGDDDSHAGTTPYFWLIMAGPERPLPTGYLPAFPGAEGFGAMTTGGRGGKNIYVTTTEPTGPGSFAEAVNTPGPRTVQFAVSGQIHYPEDLWITEDDLTLIGYTAPGEGVEIYGRLCIGASNVIMRGMRFRTRPPIEGDGMNTQGSMRNVIFDHCSFSYGSDEIVRFVGGSTFVNGSMQYCILGPGTAGLGTHPHGPEVGGVFSFHHNVLYNTMSRSPEVDCNLLDWRYNILYNTRSGHSRRLDNKMNYTDCLIIDNPNNELTYSFRCADNNYMDGNLWVSGDETTEFLPHKSTYLQVPYAAPPLTAHKAAELETVILPTVGASLPARDATDTHFLAGLKSRTGLPVYWQDNAAGWESYDLDSNDRSNFEVLKLADFPAPPAPGATAPADTDADGMPDAWEKSHGLNAINPADASTDPDRDGYTNLEEYLYRTDPTQRVDYTDPVNNKDTVFLM